MEEQMHWADQITNELTRRADSDETLKKIVKEKGYIVYDEKTPSGKIHIGSGRGWVIHDAIAKSLRNNDHNGRFILSSDDIDPFDKMNSDLPESFSQYLGMPFRNIPSPVKGYKSFADYYFTQCVEKFEEFGIDAEIESTGDRYINGDFNKSIKTILDNTDKVNNIYERLYGKSPQKLPFNPICENCGKIGTTLAYEWDSEKELIKYKCTSDLVKWAKGCGHAGEISPYNGNGKFPWKVEWAAKWPTVGVICEFAGKDHFTHGGSRTAAIAISDEILNFPPPYPSTRKSTGKGYEFFTVGGKKMSTSKGAGIGFSDATNYAPANILRYLLVATRPNAVIDFDPMETNDIILLYERFDKTERIYFKGQEVDEKEYQKHKRIYELSHVGKVPKEMPPQVSFTHSAVVMQVALDTGKAIELLKNNKNIPQNLSKENQEYIQKRLEFAKNWVEKFAPDQFRFKVQDNVPDSIKHKIHHKEKEVFKSVIHYLENHKIEEKLLYEEFYNASRRAEVEPKDFFKSAYLVLIGKEQGPKLASFVATLGKEKVIELFRQVL